MDSEALHKFFDVARSQGATDEVLVGLLRGRGWPEEDVYRALADHYESRGGVHVPAYRPSSSAKDAFLYLLTFAILATWTIGLGSVMFTLIDRWIKDTLSPNTVYASEYYEMASSLACIIVAFPVYLLAMRYIVRELEHHPEKNESPVRKWLTYIALLLAAGVVVGDLITVLALFLRGELRARFVAKAAVVLVIAGGIFWYYLGSLQKQIVSKKIMTRNSWAASIACILVVVVVVLGFRMLGSPAAQRLVQSDLRTVQSLANLAQQIAFRWNSSRALPTSLDPFPVAVKENPTTHEMFLYRPKSASEYELCAIFATDNLNSQAPAPNDSNRWLHPKGQYCFPLDASQPVPQAPYIF